MQTCVCTNYKDKIYKIVWVHDDAQGVYIGMFGQLAGSHFSYHIDGNRWFKIGRERVNEHRTIPIEEINSFNQITFQTLPLNDTNIKITAFEYRPDNKSTSEIFLENLTFSSKNQISLDSYLVRVGKESDFVKFVYAYPKINHKYDLVGCYLIKLDKFPNHKVGILLLSET